MLCENNTHQENPQINSSSLIIDSDNPTVSNTHLYTLLFNLIYLKVSLSGA